MPTAMNLCIKASEFDVVFLSWFNLTLPDTMLYGSARVVQPLYFRAVQLCRILVYQDSLYL